MSDNVVQYRTLLQRCCDWLILFFLFNPLNVELNPICHLLVLLGDLTFMDPCIVSIFQYISKKMQRYTVYLYLETALHVSGGTSTHHQERTQLYLQLLVFVTPWKYHPKHVEQFPDINKLCNVASCWIYIGIRLGAHYIFHISRIKVNSASQRHNTHKDFLPFCLHSSSVLSSPDNRPEWK